MDLANKVRSRREALGLSQEQLALRMGYSSRTSINKIENGRPCTQKIIARLADALNTTPAYLMGWEDQEETKNEQTAFSDLPRSKQELMQFCQAVPDDKADLVLRVLKSILESD